VVFDTGQYLHTGQNVNTDWYLDTQWYPVSMNQHHETEESIRQAADEIRREAKRAASAFRIDLDLGARETREALREALDEIRASFRGVWGTPSGDDDDTAAATRLSRAERKEMTRELLLDAAIEVFARKGYHGASLDDVAEAAGFTKGAVYSNFSRKSDLFRELLERETRRRNTALRTGIEAVPVALLPALAREWLDRQSTEQRDWDILTVEFWLAASLCSGRDEVMEGFGEVIDRKLEEAGLHPGLSGREIAVVVDALGTGLLMDHYLDPQTDVSSTFAKAVRKLLADVPASATPEAEAVTGEEVTGGW
jgi:AcrR family transcriptional regulator